jgi:hypothetical protein
MEDKYFKLALVVVSLFVGFLFGISLQEKNKSGLQKMSTIVIESSIDYKNCSILYHKDGWLGIWREGEEAPGLVFYAELKSERNGDMDYLLNGRVDNGR